MTANTQSATCPVSTQYAVIFDMDGTIADCKHRQHLVAGKDKDFDAFYDLMHLDTVHEPIKQLVYMVNYSSYLILICTGRPESYRFTTMAWLHTNQIPYDELIMRPDDQRYRPDFEVKQDMLEEIRKSYQVLFAVDDRNQVVSMWRESGVTCLQVAEGDF